MSGELADRVERTFDSLEMTCVRNEADLRELEAFRYRCYRDSDMVEEAEDARMTDDGDGFSNCFSFVMRRQGAPVATIRIHVVRGPDGFSQARDEYPTEIGKVFAAGQSYVEPNRLATDPAVRRSEPWMRYVMMLFPFTLAAMCETPLMCFTLRKAHINAYSRLYGSSQVTEPVEYHGLKQPMALMQIDFAKERPKLIERFPFFRREADVAERIRELFAGAPQEALFSRKFGKAA